MARSNRYSCLARPDRLQVCLPKDEGGLGIHDIKARNDSFFAKYLWNIHLKADCLWIRWVCHYDIAHASIWSLDAKKTDSPLFKSIFYLRNRMLSLCGGVAQLQQLLSDGTQINVLLQPMHMIFSDIKLSLSTRQM
jgi:hypothetical protein